MAGFNLPPGCSVRDIPGNGPEDDAAESFYEQFDKAWVGLLAEGSTYQEALEKLSEWTWDKINNAYNEGYSAAMTDARMADDYKKDEELAKLWRESSE